MVADGFTVIAIGRVTSAPAILAKLTWTEQERSGELKEYIDDSTFACRIQYYWLDNNEQFTFAKPGRFCNAPSITSKVNDLILAKMKKALL